MESVDGFGMGCGLCWAREASVTLAEDGDEDTVQVWESVKCAGPEASGVGDGPAGLGGR